MNKINFILIGKIKEKALQDLINNYIKMLSKYAKCSLIFSSEYFVSDESSKTLIDQALKKEASEVLKLIKDKDYLILLDLHGKELSSEDLASKFKEICNNNSTISILIGSSYGLDDSLRERANLKLAISKMTLTHPFTLLFILEQVFRSFKIIKGETYHK